LLNAGFEMTTSMESNNMFETKIFSLGGSKIESLQEFSEPFGTLIFREISTSRSFALVLWGGDGNLKGTIVISSEDEQFTRCLQFRSKFAERQSRPDLVKSVMIDKLEDGRHVLAHARYHSKIKGVVILTINIKGRCYGPYDRSVTAA
jgi:hypothetical protein